VSWAAALPLLTVLTSLLTGLIIFLIREDRHGTRNLLNMTGATVKLAFVFVMLRGVFQGREYEFRIPLLPETDLVLRADHLAMLFVTLSALLWFLTTIYAIGYLRRSPEQSRFFGFFGLCVSSTVGIAMAGNLLTFFIFYELLTLTTYPLVVHRGTVEAIEAGKTYLKYTLSGGVLLLLGIVWLQLLAGTVAFSPGGTLETLPPSSKPALVGIFVLLMTGFGVKAALVPLHGWLPVAMVAPAPVSALLHAVAVVKAGAFGIIRTIYDVYGIVLVDDLGLGPPLAAVAAFTIIYGSLRALVQDNLKQRLAYSTVSQLSYIVLGVAVIGPLASVGGIVHLVHQGLMKITLFFCAGNYAETLGIHRVSRLDGVGRRMPLTTIAFTLAAFGMIGVPPLAGFVSKWYLGLGALQSGQPWVLAVLAVSSLLNAAYLLPILHRAWFREPLEQWERATGAWEADWRLLVPTLCGACFSLLSGLAAGAALSPRSWVLTITTEAYRLWDRF
jgi:multicomponent Na+:H+ antiporter subunit D